MNQSEPTLRANLQALPRGVWILFFGTFLNKFGAFVLPFLAIYMKRLGYSGAQAGLALGAYGFGHLLASFFGGYLADRIGRRLTIVVSMLSSAAVMLCMSQARAVELIILFSGLAGLAGELYRPAGAALLADLTPAGQRVTAYAVYRAAFNAGWTFGPAVAGFLAQTSYFWLFVGDASTSVLYGLVAWFALPDGRKSDEGGNGLRETLRVLREDKKLRQVLCSSLVVGLVFVQVFSTFSLEITRSGFLPSTYGLLISLNGALVVLFELPLTTITRRRPPRQMMALGYVVCGLAFATNLLPRTPVLLVLTIVLLTLGEILCMPISAAYVADLAPSHQRGLYMGAFGLVWALTFVLGPSLGTLLYASSSTLVWLICGVMGFIAATIILAEPAPSIPRSRQPDRALHAGEPISIE